MVRIMLGQGRLMTRMPPAPWGMSWPVSSTTAAAMPGSASVQLPGTSGVAPGSGAITWPPVSVCQKVSTMGQRSPPTFLWYHIQASGLIGSPTPPRRARAPPSQPPRGAALAAHVLVVPHPGFGVDRLADAAQDAQAAQIRARRVHRSVGLGGLDQR